MQVKSGDPIEIKAGFLKSTVRGFSLTNFNSDDENTDFELRRINKDDTPGEVVTYNTSKVTVSEVTDDKYVDRPAPERHDEQQTNSESEA